MFNKKRSTIADASRDRQYARDGALQVTWDASIPAFYPSCSPLGGLLLLPPPWLSPPSVMSSSPDAAAAACGSTFSQISLFCLLFMNCCFYVSSVSVASASSVCVGRLLGGGLASQPATASAACCGKVRATGYHAAALWVGTTRTAWADDFPLRCCGSS